MVTSLTPFFARLTLSATVVRATSSWRGTSVNRHLILQKKAFHIRPTLFQSETISNPTSAVGNPNIGSASTRSSSQTQQYVDEMKHAAYLGEADSNDGHDAFLEAYAKRHEAMDGSNSAYLGEADSDDNYQIQKDIEGEKLEPLDAKNAAFLGEADSDD